MRDAYFISLLSAAINDEEPMLPPEDIDWKRIYMLADYNSVASAVYYAVCKLPDEAKPDKNVFNMFKKSMQLALGVETMQQYEITELMKSFEEQGIVYAPLKGWIIKKLYPCTYMRTMCDADILISESNRKKAADIALGRGFENKGHSANDDGYIKSGNVAVELHWKLFDSESPYHDYFYNIIERADNTEVENRKMLKLEDFYLHLVAHLEKHFTLSGTGVRSFADIWLFLKKYSERLDWEYVNKGLKELGLDRFEPIIAKTAVQWFGNEEDIDFKETSDAILEYVLYSGTYGNQNIQIASALDKREGSNFRYVMGRLFPRIHFMKMQFPILEKLPFLLPACWLIRGFQIMFFRRNRIKREFNVVKNTNSKEISDVAKIKKMCGLGE